ncbi:hypothetical protein C2845_PM11G02950 [Panicum miliaceum]|uniref:Uncharacterized protein n=1 Tax=Panicum miliaceum TaxID=4540 RepID=A0A3L6RUK6_PANMI|nr:hypothetical protein C2845_PM11G02950 [Panicum miliaceum]
MSKKKKKKAKKGRSQKIEVPSLLDKELELLKSEHSSLVCKYNSLAKDYARATEYLSCVASFEKAYEMLTDRLDKLTSEHMTLQATHKGLEYSHEKLVESYVALDIAHEVVVTSVKTIEPFSHTCTCSHVETMLSCDKPCCSQATKSCVGHVVVESCDDLIAQEDDELKREVEKLKLELTKLKSKGQVQPSQDNRDIMVKKLERGSNVTSSAL